MEESESSGSDDDHQTKGLEIKPTTQRMDSDESYSDSESDELKEPKSMYNIHKPGHIPGKYKQSIEPASDQQSSGQIQQEKPVKDVGDNQDGKSDVNSDVKTGRDTGVSNENEENVLQETPQISTEQRPVVSESGIFEKSMVMISFIPDDERDGGKSSMRKVRPNIPPKPNRSPSSVGTGETSVAVRPKPAPRRSKCFSEIVSDENSLQSEVGLAQKRSPKPMSRQKRKIDSIDNPPDFEKKEMVASIDLQAKEDVDTTVVEDGTVVSMSDSKGGHVHIGRTSKPDIDEEDELVSVDAVDIGSAIKENTDGPDEVPEKEDALTYSALVKDMDETTFRENKSTDTLANREAEILASVNIADLKDDTDTEIEESATFKNDFLDTDSVKDYENVSQTGSDNESDDPFKTPDNHSDSETDEFYESNSGSPMHDIDKVESDTKIDDAEPLKAQDACMEKIDSNVGVKFETNMSGERETNFEDEESIVVIGKGTVKQEGYLSIPSNVSSYEITEEASSGVETRPTEKVTQPSIRDRISMFESIGQGEIPPGTNEFTCKRLSKSNEGGSSFEILKNDINESFMTDSCADSMGNIGRKLHIDEKRQDIQKANCLKVDLDSSDDTQTNSADHETKTANMKEDRGTEKTFDYMEKSESGPVYSYVENDRESCNNEMLENEVPPPIPPKSELVLESMRSFITTDDSSPISLVVHSDRNDTPMDTNTQSFEHVSNNEDTETNAYVCVPHSDGNRSDIARKSLLTVGFESFTETQTISDQHDLEIANIEKDQDSEHERDEKPPIVPPKSELVYESIKSFAVDTRMEELEDKSMGLDTTPKDTDNRRGDKNDEIADDKHSTAHEMGHETAQASIDADKAADMRQRYSQPEMSMNYQNYQMPTYPNMQFQQQAHQQMWGQCYYTDERGNVQMVNPYAYFNPNVNPGMFHHAPNIPYQQPQYFSHQFHTTGNEQTPRSDAGFTSHQSSHSESFNFEQRRKPENERKAHAKVENQEEQSDRKSNTPSEQRRTQNVEHHEEHHHSPREERQKTTSERQMNSGFHVEHKSTDGAKLTKSRSEEPVTEQIYTNKSTSSPIRRSASSPMYSRGKPGYKEGETKREVKGHVQEENDDSNQKQEYYIYFRGINPVTGKDNLSNFIEATTRGECETEKVIFNNSKTCALVTLSLNHIPDISKAEERIQSRGIDGEKPEVYVVQAPESIAVSSENDIKSTESLGLYFESSRAGGTELTQDPYESEDGSCFIVQYGDPEVVRRVCTRSHKWEGNKLRVSPYYECKAGAIWDGELHVVKIPGPITEPLQPSYLLLLQRDCCKQLLEQLEKMHCNASFRDDGLHLQCTLTPKTASFKTLVKDWENASTGLIKTFISENISEGTVISSENVWKELLTYYKSENFEERPDVVSSLENSSYTIILVGLKDAVKDVETRINEMRKQIEKRLSRKTESISVPSVKLQLYVTAGVFENMRKELDDIDVFVGDREITVEGQPEDIKAVKVKMHEADDKISQSKSKHSFSRDFVEFINRKLSENISSILAKHKINAQWQIDDREFTVYVFESQGGEIAEEGDYEKFADDDFGYSNVDNASINVMGLLKAAILEVNENVQDNIVEVLTSPEWTSFIESVTEEYENTAEVEYKSTAGKLFIYGMTKETLNLQKKVKAFLEDNAIMEDIIKCRPVDVRFIKLHRTELTASLEQKFEYLKVRVTLNDESVKVSGTKIGIAEVKKELKQVFDSMTSEKYTIQKVAVQDVFRDAKVQGTIDVVEKETKCLIILPGEGATFMVTDPVDFESDESDDGFVNIEHVQVAEKARPAAPPRAQEFKASNGVKVTLVRGELGEQDGDVIVVATSPNLNLSSGNACKSLLKVGGPRLQDECKEHYQSEIKFGEIAAVRGTGRLECNRVYFTTLPNWTSENSPRQVLEKVMRDALEMASKHKKHSILFSAMGTGQLKYPTDLVAMLMYQAVIDFDQNNPQTTLKDVRFILYQKDYSTIKAFEEEEQLRLEGGGERPTFDLKAGNVSIELSVENIAQQKVDGLLCSTSPNMDLSRNGACQALLRAGGTSLQDECKSKYNNTLEEGKVVDIGGGNLSCKCVFLTVLSAYSPDAIGVLTNVIETLLKLAQAKGLTSLALPALGTGFLKYPAEQVCRCMFQTVCTWAQANPKSTIKTVRFIMHAKDHKVIQMFKSHIVNAKGRGKREGRRSLMGANGPAPPGAAAEPKKSIYNAHSHGVQIGKIKLSVILDDILSQRTDAIVSSVGGDFEFVGAVAQELKKRFPKLEQECKRPETKQKLISDGVVFTKGFGLHAKSIIHVKFAEDLSTWQTRMYKCLEKANKHSLKSIAFPVLGTGQGFTCFNPDAIAGCLFDAIDKFFQRNRKTSIRNVTLIVYKGQPAMLKPITDQLQKKVQEAAAFEKDSSWTKGISKTFKKYGKAAWGVVMGTTEGLMTDEARKKLMQATSSLEVHIYSDSKTNITKCKQELDAKLEKVYTKKKIEDYKALVKTLTTDEMKELDIVALANIKFDTQAGIITIYGPTKQVSDVAHELHGKLLKIERQRNDRDSAEELSKIVEWQYEEVTETQFKLTSYSKTLNQKIERAYKGNEPSFEFDDDDGDTFVIDFQNLIEYRKSDDQDKLRVVRKDILKSVASSALPEDWAQMKDNENIKLVNVTNTDKEYKDIEQRFISEVKTGSYAQRLNFDPNNMQVSKIERIQNKTLHQQYEAKKKQMTEQKPNLPANMPIERDLWHGTKYDAITSIQMHGFNRSYSGNANGEPWYGQGVYFAANASYSARGWLSGAGSGSKGYMFVVKTLTGQFIKGQKGMRYLPPVDPKHPTVLYDCAVDNPAKPMEFVIFNDTQAYPAYIITFTT